MNKKAFTLIEMLVVVLILVILVSIFQMTYGNAKIVRANERARARFIEITNAAKLFNETYPDTKIYGGFGNAEAQNLGYLNPCNLFLDYFNSPNAEYNQEVRDNIYPYALRARDWGLNNAGNCSSALNYEGYTFVFCNPSFVADAQQPTEANGHCKADRFAVMITPNDVTYPKFSGKIAWITRSYELLTDYL